MSFTFATDRLKTIAHQQEGFMSREPSYPEDSPVGGRPVGDPKGAGETQDEREAQDRADSRKKKQIVTGAAIGIGSAALVAALLYANRSRGKDKKGA
jgi:hypothetical protein